MIKALTTIISVVVILLLAEAGGAAEMMTYKNEEYGFSIDFPEDWTAIANYMGAVVVFMGPEKEGTVINVNIVVEELPKTMTVEEYAAVSERAQKNATISYRKDKSYSTTINGEPCVILTFTATYTKDAPEVKQKLAYFMRNTTAYIVSCTASPITYDEANENYFEPMIHSFEFIAGVTPTPIPSPSSTPEEGVPGFEAVFAIIGLLAVAYLLTHISHF